MAAVSMKSCVKGFGLAGAAVLALAGLASCDQAPPAAPPPPPAAYQAPPPPPPLLGAPPAQDVAPAPAPEREFVAMAPIPNPEDLSPAERRRIYGEHFWTNHHYIAGIIRAKHHGAWHAAPGAAPVAASAPKPVVVAKPAAPKAVTPKLVAAPPPAAAPAPSPVDQLAAAVTAKSKGAMLAVPADLSAAKPGTVTLSLPADLFATIRQEAAKLGLGRAAKKTEVTATLHGDGYTITPPGPQTAALVPGKPATFTWQVAPGPVAKGPLTADVSALLKGAGEGKTIALSKLNQAVAAVDAAAAEAQAAAHRFKLPSLDMLSIPGHKTVTLPVVGKTPSKSIVGALIVLVALFLLAMAARTAGARREAENRQRRYRTMAPVMSAERAVEHVEPLAPAAHEPQVEQVYAAPAEAEPVLVEAHTPHHPEGVEDHPVAEAHPDGHAEADHGAVEAAPPVAEAPASGGHGVPGVTPSLEPRGPVVENIVADDHDVAEAHAAADDHAAPAEAGYPTSVEHVVETHAEPAEAHHDDATHHQETPAGHGLVLELV